LRDGWLSGNFGAWKRTGSKPSATASLAIIITIMVLELKVPHATELAELKPLLPVFMSYVLSFVYVAIYWNNHHHLFHSTKLVSAGSRIERQPRDICGEQWMGMSSGC
jgi:hypothetical protein